MVRGIGKAYSSFDAGPTVGRSVSDVVAATDYLRRRFGQQKIFLFGESGGTITGVLAVERHPERYLGWIGSGQMVNRRGDAANVGFMGLGAPEYTLASWWRPR